MFRPEILAPAGNLFKLKTAVRYGADAVYIAGRKFGLRSAADNFTDAEIHEACRFAHAASAKVYVVLNGFLFNHELDEAPPFLKILEEAGVDAVIVSDLGVLETVHRHSNLAVHLSTQASTLNTLSAKFWKSCGVTRIVLGREASIAEAAAIKRDAGIEVEMFVHGAMCMAYSGHCTISNYTAGRDSNRGGCIQSCRFRYTFEETGTTDHFLSSKDLESAALMPHFIEAEIDSLKIEGRMKSALYVATTARTYAAARDAIKPNSDIPDFARLQDELDTMSHRDYTTASLITKAGRDSVYDHQEQSARHLHLGHVVSTTDQSLALRLKNPLEVGDHVEVLLPQGGEIILDTRRLRRLDGSVVDSIPPNHIALLPPHPEVRQDLVVRKQIHDPSNLRTARAAS